MTRNSSHVYSVGFQCLTACNYISHNLAREAYPTRTRVICRNHVPRHYVPQECEHMVVNHMIMTNHVRHHAVTVDFDHERIIVFYVDNFKTLKMCISRLCSVCCSSEINCGCPVVMLGNKMALCDGDGNRIETEEQFLSKMSSTSCFYAELDYETRLQSNKTYKQILTEPEHMEPMVKLLEDVMKLFYDFYNCRGTTDLVLSMSAFFRSVTGRSSVYLFKDLIEKLSNSLSETTQLQSDKHWTETLSDVYENYSKAKKTILSERLKKVFNHVIAHSVYHKLGIEVDQALFEKFEEQKIRINLVQCYTFVDAAAGLITFLLKQGRQCMLLGSIEPLYITGDTAGDWFERSKSLLMKFQSICNPVAIGEDLHNLLSNLNNAIEEGKCLRKYSLDDKSGNFYISKMVLELERCYNSYLTSIAACAMRKCPFAFVVYGRPGIGKSSIIDILLNYDCKIRNKDQDRKFRYPHPSDSDHFDGYRTWMHTVIYEDVAQLSPNKIQGVDPSCQFFMKTINMMSWCPPQAELENKGKTPMMAETCVVSSNTIDLNIPVFYNHSFAPMRRFPLHIEPVVRAEFRKSDGTIDKNKAQSIDGEYDDFWEFIIREPVAMEGDNKYRGVFKVRPDLFCKDMKALLKLYRDLCLEHHREQTLMLSRMAGSTDVKVCTNCGIPGKMCPCTELQFWRSSDESTHVPPHLDPSTDEWRTDYVNLEGARVASPTYRAGFLSECQKRKSGHYNKAVMYNHYHLNKSLSLGYTDEMVYQDFLRFVDHEPNEDVAEMADMFCETTVERKLNNGFMIALIKIVIYLYFRFYLFRSMVRFSYKRKFVKEHVYPIVRPYLIRSDVQLYFVKKAGEALDKRIGKLPQWGKYVLSAVAALGFVGVLMKFKNMYSRKDTKSQEVSKETPPVSRETEVHVYEFQELTFTNKKECEPPSTDESVLQMGHFPKPVNEKTKVNHWLTPERTLTNLDFSTKRVTESNAFYRNLGFNTVLCSHRGRDIADFVTKFHVLALSEFVFITNSHNLPPSVHYDLTFHFGPIGSGDEIRFRIYEKQIQRFTERDILVIHTKAVPNRFKKIRENFPRRSYQGVFNGVVFTKREDGSINKKELTYTRPSRVDEVISETQYNYDCYMGRVSTETLFGDSGAPWTAETGYGTIIIGLHTFRRSSGVVACTRVYLEDVHEWCRPMMSEVGTIEVVGPILQREKSYIDYHKEKFITYHGELDGHRTRPKHHVYETELAEHIFGKEVCGHPVNRRLTGPVMDNWRPQQVSLTEFVTPVSTMNEVVLEECLEVMFNRFDVMLTEDDKAMFHPYPMEVAINGAPGITFVDSIKKSTSMGYPWKKTKRAYLVPLEDDRFQDGVEFTPEVMQRIEDRLERLKQGIRMHPVFSASLKDEPVSFKKFAACKTRVFFCCPADFLILVRMCFMSFCRVVQRNPYVFNVAVGLNPHSIDWQRIYDHLNVHPSSNTVAGDHVFYDKKMQLVLLKSIMLRVIGMFEKYGDLSKEELCVYYALVEDMVNPSVDYFGMLVTFMGGEVSGHQMTTILNCMCTVTYVMYCYHETFDKVNDFFEHVAIISLGDDHVFTVSDDRRELNHTKVQKCLQNLGLNYTMADKDKESVPFIELSEAPFLKRKFTYNSTLGYIVGPIEVDTIFKMLTVSVESKVVSREEQLAQSLCCAVSEAFFHGKEFFEEFISFIESLPKSERLCEKMKDYPALKWEGYIRRYNDTIPTMASSHGQSQNEMMDDSYCHNDEVALQCCRSVDHPLTNHARAFPEIRIYGRMELDPGKSIKALENELPPSHENLLLASINTPLVGNYADHDSSTLSSVTTDTHQQTTMFVNEPQSDVVDISTPLDKVATTQKVPADLGDFFKRPSFIYSYRWQENSPPGYKDMFKPWALYFSQPKVKSKMEGFGLLRATLRLKFMVNGSPFYYGKIGAFYRPYQKALVDPLVDVGLRQILVSQLPHVWLDNQSTSTEEMVLPFLCPNNFVPTEIADLEDLGVIDLWQFAALRSANGVSTDGIDITVYAYCEEFELAALTNKAVLQSKKEYLPNGQISGPASTVASVASKLKDVPVIGAYATATETAANMVSSVANFFGFTNVPNVSDVEPIKQVPFQLASSSISEPVMKLSLQPKQEIAVGSEYCGGSKEDELMIEKLVSRESFLCGTLWATSADQNDVLFKSQVTPCLYEFDSTRKCVGHTPLSYWSCLFEYWRGSIIFRFKVVRSPYHRGRLNINWDPKAVFSGDVPSIGNITTMNIVLDLDQTDEVEVEIPYVQAKTFLKCITANWGFPTSRTWENSAATPVWNTGEHNGNISVSVLNRLTAPEATSDVDVLVFVRAGKNFEFAAPCEINPNWTHNGREDTVLQSNKIYEVGDTSLDDDTYREVFGEKIVSVRELLHRSSLSFVMTPNTASGAANFNINVPLKRYPLPPGFYNNGWYKATGANGDRPYNFSRMTHINWVLPVFVGYKGSVNVTVNCQSNNTVTYYDRMEICRRNTVQSVQPEERRPKYYQLLDTANGNQRGKLMNSNSFWGHDGLSGMALTNQRTNTGLVVNLPYYTRSKWLDTDPTSQYSNTDIISDSNSDWFDFQANFTRSSTTVPFLGQVWYFFYATGPDFDVVFNLNCPVVYYKDVPGANET